MKSFVRGVGVWGLCALLLSACGDGYSDPISGHQVGAQSPKATVEVGRIEVRISRVVASRKIKIPNTYAFRFGWTSDAYDRRNRARGLRQPTERDWQKYEASLVGGRVKSKGAAVVVKSQRKRERRTKFKPVVTRGGKIAFCNDTWGGKYGCTTGLSLTRAERLRLTRAALAKTQPRCKIGQIDPPKVAALHPEGMKSGKLSVVATIICP
ncbi:hypothetical protein ABMC88_08640 [Sulfitobacter sp. HNIBRBA2951]|uniref:hypothetical protein n=1 Tax=Sulfitobacter aquimarinus TaxID=3158557 RepID=UPI0032DF11A5